MAGFIKLLITLAIIGAGVKYFVLGEKSERDIIVDVGVRMINEQKGKMIDNETLLKGAYESSRGLVINYQLIDFQPIAFNVEEFKKEMHRNAKFKNCGKQIVKDVLDMDVEVTYVYYDAFDKKIAETVLTKKTCK